VIVVEGEWCADALAKAGVLATTSGAADSAAKADWRSLAGRDVTIWPDNDEAGQRYATEAAEKLLALGCTVHVIDVEKLGLPKKGDAVDWCKANPAATTAAEIAALPCVEARQRARPGNGASPAGVCGGGEASMAGEDPPRPFPVLSEAARYGVFKEIVELGTRKSEADPAAVLMTALTFASAAIGTKPHMWVGDTRHHARLYSVLVGASSRARKGTSRDPVERIFLAAQRELRRMPQLRSRSVTTSPLPLGRYQAARDWSMRYAMRLTHWTRMGNPSIRVWRTSVFW
jgi:Toprim domain-containing protein